MNISLVSNGVEIYFDIGAPNGVATNDEIRSHFYNEHFLRELSTKFELYMRLEAIYGKAETEGHAQRRLQAVLERFEGREQVLLLALRRQMELSTQSSIGDNTGAGMSETKKDNTVVVEPKPSVTKTKGKNKRPTRNQDANNGIANLSTDADIDADISADLDNLLLDGPVEM